MDSGVTTIRCRIESAVDTAIGLDVSSQMKKRVLEIPDPQPRVKLEVQIEASQLLHGLEERMRGLLHDNDLESCHVVESYTKVEALGPIQKRVWALDWRVLCDDVLVRDGMSV